MKMERPEKCVELLIQHFFVIRDSTAKLQVFVECFDALTAAEAAEGGEDRVFKNLSIFARGIVNICQEVIDDLWKCDICHVANQIKLFSVDPLKIAAHIVYLKSIGIHNVNPDIEFEDPDV